MAYTIDAAIRAAAGEVGYRERGTNDTKFNRWLGRLDGYPHDGYGYAWCVSFQGWTADQGGGRAGVDYPRTASCAVAVAWFKSKRRWSSVPHTGDWVFYGPGGSTHVELVIGVTSRTITTIGGNTSGSLSGRYYAGDGVYKKTVTRASSRIYGYGRPIYGSEDDMPSVKDIWEWDGIPSPRNASTHKKNPTWKPSSFLVENAERIRDLQVSVAANGAAIGELSKTVAALAADRGQIVDADALVARIKAAIESVTVRLDVQDAEDAS